jgi:hypothetical protein
MRKVEDTKGVIRSRKSKKDWNIMAKRKKDKRTNNNLQNTTQKTKDWATWTPQKNGNELGCCGWISSSCSASGTGHEWLLFNAKWAIIQLYHGEKLHLMRWWCLLYTKHVAELDLESASSLKQQSLSRHVA